MRRFVSTGLVVVGAAFMVVAVVSFRSAFGPCTTDCSVFAENAKMFKGYGAAATAAALVSWCFAGLLHLERVRQPPPYRVEDRP